ncbi:hypothetical protein GW17_00037639 [Ensete ventricosum]|nr:hypothetical protein GW17_00037639 [Ensete ventricosum]
MITPPTLLPLSLLSLRFSPLSLLLSLLSAVVAALHSRCCYRCSSLLFVVVDVVAALRRRRCDLCSPLPLSLSLSLLSVSSFLGQVSREQYSRSSLSLLLLSVSSFLDQVTAVAFVHSCINPKSLTFGYLDEKPVNTGLMKFLGLCPSALSWYLEFVSAFSTSSAPFTTNALPHGTAELMALLSMALHLRSFLRDR